MELIKVSFDNVANVVTDLLVGQKEACVYCIAEETGAIVGSNGGADIDEIKHRNIKLIQINHEGGTIIANAGDVEIGIFTKGYSGREYRDNIVNGIINLLKEKGYNAYIQGNDILINGRKVVGFGSRMFGKILYTAIQISVNINLELIKTICTKTMVKQPDGLKNYGVDTEDILDIMHKAFNDKSSDNQ